MNRLLLPLLAACAPEAAPCPACPTCDEAATGEPAPAAAAGGGTLTLAPWEADLLGDQVARLRAGVLPFGAEGWGLCRGEKRCEAFEGTDPGTLAPGDHLLRAELAVPPLGAGWTVRLDQACTVQPPAGQPSERTHSRTLDVAYAGENRGYRLEPLLRIHAPAPDGERTCTATLVPLRPDGVEGTPLTARWRVPGPG